MKWFKKVLYDVQKFSKNIRFGDFTCIIIVILSALIFFIINIKQHYSFQTYAFDLGIYIQALYSTTKGLFLFENPDYILAGTKSFFGIHFSPLTLLLVPVFQLFPYPETLFVIQEIGLALGFLYLYRLSNLLLNNKKISLIILISYVLNPLIHAAVMFPFHIEVFLPAFSLAAFYYLKKKSFLKYLIFILLINLTIDFAIFLAISISIYGIILNIFADSSVNIRLNIKEGLIKNKKFFLPLILSITMLFIAIRTISSFGPKPLSEGGLFYILGNNYMEIAINMLINPYLVLKSIYYALIFKIGTFLIILLPIIPYVFNEFYSWIPSIPLLALLFLTTLQSIYTPGHHIQGLFFTQFFYYIGISGLSKKLKKGNEIKSIVKKIAFLSISSFLFFSPLMPLDFLQSITPNLGVSYVSKPKESPVYAYGHKMIQLIPSNASILASDTIFPHIACNTNTYLSLPEGVEPDYAIVNLNHGDYFLKIGNRPSFAAQFEELLKSDKYDVVGYAHGFTLIKKNYHQPPKIFIPYKFQYDTTNIHYGNFEIVDDTTNGKVLIHNKGSHVFVFGPYTHLPFGVYQITFYIKGRGIIKDSDIAKLDVVTSQGKIVLSERRLYGFELEEDAWTPITLEFVTSIPLQNVEFRILEVSNTFEELYMQCIIVDQISLEIHSSQNYIYLSADKFILVDGYCENGIYVHKPEDDRNVFFYGPYIPLEDGGYKAFVFLKIVPTGLLLDTIMKLDIVRDRGEIEITHINILSKDIKLNEWNSIVLEFQLDEAYEDIEIRGTQLSKEICIYFSQIVIEKLG